MNIWSKNKKNLTMATIQILNLTRRTLSPFSYFTSHYRPPFLLFVQKAPNFEYKFEHLGVDEYLNLHEYTRCMHVKKSRSGHCVCVNCLKGDCGICTNCIDMRKQCGLGIREKRGKKREFCNNNKKM